MKKTILIIIGILFYISNLIAQDYFQQEVNYKINVILNDSTNELSAYEEIEYINNSSDNLDFIYFHLWANAFENNSTALAKQKFDHKGKKKYFESEPQRGYIDSLDFRVNGEKAKWEIDQEHIDICKVFLNKPLKNGEKVIITTPFHIKLPRGSSSKLGYIRQSYRISQWYPKPAVYDKYGWHQMPNLDIGEFYSEFGSFEVSITLPENYVVAATGNLVSEKEIDWLNKKVEQTISKTDFSKTIKPEKSSPQQKTIKFTQDKIHDFAWFADKNYNVLKSEVILPETDRTITIWAFFWDRNYNHWKNTNKYLNDAILYYSNWYGEYPYNNCTAVDGYFSGGGGIEYPTITLIGSCPTLLNFEQTVAHEVAHNWFYGVLGFNEREHPWLDEGITTFTDDRYMKTKYPNAKLYKFLYESEKKAKRLGIENLKYTDLSRQAYLFNARRNLDQAANLSSEEYSKANYLTSVIYKKNSVSFKHLMNYLGEKEFNRIMKSFYKKWEYKHPYPNDLVDHFKKNTDNDLDWFFEDLLKTTKKLDYAVRRIKNDKILIKNKGRINAPFSLSGIKDSTVIYTKWYNGFEGKKWFSISTNDVDRIYIDYNKNMPDLYYGNNAIKTSGLFKKVEPIKLSLIGLVNDPDRTNINIFPIMGWNNYNKYMLGAVFYNSILPANKFEYQLAPMFSFGSKDLAGTGRIAYHIYPYNNIFQEVTMSLSAMQFAYEKESGSNFRKFKAALDFRLKKRNLKNFVDNYIRFSAVSASDLEMLLAKEKPSDKQFYNFQYEHRNWRDINRYKAILNIQSSSDFVKTSIEANYRYTYMYNKTLDIRFFGGAFLYKSDQMASLYNINLSGNTGASDYTFDNFFFGRFENPTSPNVLAQQFARNEGGFSTYSPLGQSDEWLVSTNISTSLPFIPKGIPIQAYGNFALTGNSKPVVGYPDPEIFHYELGLKVNIVYEAIELYFPLAMSKDIQNFSNEVTSNYWQKIRFTIYLNEFNPFEIFRSQKDL